MPTIAACCLLLALFVPKRNGEMDSFFYNHCRNVLCMTGSDFRVQHQESKGNFGFDVLLNEVVALVALPFHTVYYNTLAVSGSYD